MAKSSRGRGRKSSKRQVDWVVNDETYGSVISLPNTAQVLLALTIPKFAVSFVDPLLAVVYPGYQFPEQDSGQVAYAVRGHVQITPSVWAAGTNYRLMFRIVKKPVEYSSALQAIVDPFYNLYEPEFANERFNWQKLVAQDFNLGSAGEVLNINWTGHQRIEPDECLWLAVENQSGITISATLRPFLRTLMRADA